MHQRFAEALEVCDRVAARLERGNTDAHLVLEAMRSLTDCSTGHRAIPRDRAAALVAEARRPPAPALAEAA